MSDDLLEVPLFKDMHQHLREGDEVPYTTAWADRWCDDIVAMPNLRNPLTNAGLIQQYRNEVLAPHYKNVAKAIIPLYITEQTTPDDIKSAHEAGVQAAKFYPRGKTSHSAHGVVDYAGRVPVLKEMARVGMRALFHPEHPKSNAWESEHDFVYGIWPIINRLVMEDNLYVSLEHISTLYGLFPLENDETGRVVATVTPHHLLAHVGHIGDQWDSAFMCKPMLKDPDDQRALIDAVTGGHDRLSLGSDSAPWPLVSKARIKSCSGCWTAPWLPQLVATIFDRAGRLDNLVKFAHDNAVRWWGLEPSAGRIRLTRGETVIPEIDHGYWLGYLPFLGGQTLPWKAERILEGVNDDVSLAAAGAGDPA